MLGEKTSLKAFQFHLSPSGDWSKEKQGLGQVFLVGLVTLSLRLFVRDGGVQLWPANVINMQLTVLNNEGRDGLKCNQAIICKAH